MDHTAEIVELKAYRERKAASRHASPPASTLPYGAGDAQMPMPFVMPVMVMFYWPTWFLPSHYAPVLSQGGGVA